MGSINLPLGSGNTGTNDWSDVYNNDAAIVSEVNGNLDNTNLKSAAAIAYSKLASMSTGAILLGNAGTPTATTLGGDATIGATGTLTIANDAVNAAKIAANAVGASEIGSLPACRVTRITSAQSISDSTMTAVSFNGETFDTDTMHDTVTNPSRITFTTGGVYVISATISFDANNTGRRTVLLRTGAGMDIARQMNTSPNSSSNAVLTVSAVYKFAAAEYVECYVYHTKGSALDVKTDNTAVFGTDEGANTVTTMSASYIGDG